MIGVIRRIIPPPIIMRMCVRWCFLSLHHSSKGPEFPDSQNSSCTLYTALHYYYWLHYALGLNLATTMC